MKKILLTLLLTPVFAITLKSQSSMTDDTVRQTQISSVADPEMDQELRTPMVGPKLQPYVTSYMMELARNLHRERYSVETMRRGEVVIVTIPTDNLFPQNETTLLPDATRILEPFERYLKPEGRFKLILAVHSDNTGSEEYLFDLTEARINAILDHFEANGFPTDHIIGFPKGASEPLNSNMSHAERTANRRLELYIVPDELLLNEARTSKK